jgi:PIN domain nuclease of toxin-antitoxin system
VLRVKILLDTHVWLWGQLSPERLSAHAADAMEDPENTLLFSAASSWEIAIKYALKKLELPDEPARYVPSALRRGGVTPLPVEHAHALRVSQLPHHHRDPFDRLLVAQAQLEGATLVTADPRFLLYDVDALWAAAGEPPSEVHDALLGRARRAGRSVVSSGARRRRHSPTQAAGRAPRRPSRAPRGRRAK